MTKKKIIRLNIIRKISRNICIQTKIMSLPPYLIQKKYLVLTTKNTCQIIFFSTFITISERRRGIYHIYCRIIDSLKRT